MQFLRALIESRPFFTRIPDQALIVGDAGQGGHHLQAPRDAQGSYAFVYFPETSMTTTIDLSRLSAQKLRAWWYDPRTGVGTLIGVIDSSVKQAFTSPPYGPDWVLVLDDSSASYPPPGLDRWVGEGSK
jgi:hypothetical protein